MIRNNHLLICTRTFLLFAVEFGLGFLKARLALAFGRSTVLIYYPLGLVSGVVFFLRVNTGVRGCRDWSLKENKEKLLEVGRGSNVLLR